MNKLIKKISLILAVILLISNCGMPVMAAEPTEGSITIWKYSPLSTGGTPGDGETGPSGDYRPIKGVEYTIYRVADWTDGKVGSGYNSLINGITFTGSTTPESIYNKIKTDGFSSYRTVTTGSNGSVKAGNLPLGLYLVVETNVKDAVYADGKGGNANITKLGEPFFVSVPTAKASGDGYLYDISVFPKNATTTVSKEANEDVGGVGDKVQYVITIGIPQNVSSLERFIVTDTLPNQVDYVSSGVYLDREGKTPASNAIYTKTEPDGSSPSILKVIFDVKSTELNLLAGKEVFILVDTVINKNALIVDEITNNLTVDYGSDTPNVEVGEKTYVGKITIEKVDKDTDEKLDGVQFKLYREVEGKKEYIKDPNDALKDYVVTTVNGVAVFAGLNNGIYFVEEVKSANGYQLLRDPIQVEVTNDEKAPLIELKITNIKKFDLPITGGMGTTLFIIVGAALIISGLGFFIVTRRKGSQEEK